MIELWCDVDLCVGRDRLLVASQIEMDLRREKEKDIGKISLDLKSGRRVLMSKCEDPRPEVKMTRQAPNQPDSVPDKASRQQAPPADALGNCTLSVTAI